MQVGISQLFPLKFDLNTHIFDLFLFFRTGGELFSQQHNDNLIELSVNLEGLKFISKTSGKLYEENILGDFLNNKWHTVYFQYRLGNLTVTIDGIGAVRIEMFLIFFFFLS